MATIDTRRAHSLGLETAKERAEELAKDMQGQLGIEWSWQGDKIQFKAASGKAKGTKGQVTVTASEVRVEVDLPLLLRAMKGVIASKVDEKLDKVLA
jgi:putative polyhydroxyalkanoate system protein